MEESASWKGHGFTLLVFGGIVVLCSIFFVLGMLVGRSQGQRIAENPSADHAAKLAPVDSSKPEEVSPARPSFDNAEDKVKPAPVPAAVPAPKAEVAPVVEEPAPAKAPVIVKATNFQIGAVRNSKEAEKLRNEVKSKGFPAFILMPPPGDKNPYYRVQVGPYSSDEDAALAKRKLESSGYTTIKK